uniref:ER membrane protein complex subunit 2 n=1 Tax=Glossina brevipalpis TaxID=37001 RepID=A0A1A9VZF2_9MUSC
MSSYDDNMCALYFRKWREDNERRSNDVINLWEAVFEDKVIKTGNEKNLILEQVIVAALDTARLDIAEKCIKQLSSEFPGSLRVMKFKAMQLETMERYNDAVEVLDAIIAKNENNAAPRRRKSFSSSAAKHSIYTRNNKRQKDLKERVNLVRAGSLLSSLLIDYDFAKMSERGRGLRHGLRLRTKAVPSDESSCTEDSSLDSTADLSSNFSKLSGRGRARRRIQESIKLPILATTADGSPLAFPQVIHAPKDETTKDSTDKESSKASNLLTPPKPRHGTKGAPERLACNYIRIKSDPNRDIFVYEMRFVLNIDSSRLKEKYLSEHRDKFGGIKNFDGTNLYLPILLKDKLTTYVSKAHDGSDIGLRIHFKRKEILKDSNHENIKFREFDRKQFDPTSAKVLPKHHLELWPGYVTAVDEHEGGLLLCCDISHKLLCQKTVLETLLELY